MILFALTNGFLDKIQVEDILTFQDGLFDYFDGSHKDLLDEIATTGQLPDTDKLKAAVQEFSDTFQGSASSEEDAKADK